MAGLLDSASIVANDSSAPSMPGPMQVWRAVCSDQRLEKLNCGVEEVSEPIVLENDPPEFEAVKETPSSIGSSTARPRWNAQRREYPPSEHSIQPLDYAFYLLGDTSDKTIVVIGSD